MDSIVSIVDILLKKAGLEHTDITTEQILGQKVFQIKTQESRHLIGVGGDTLRAIDYLVKKIAEKNSINEERFIIDVDGYLSKQIKDIQQKALMMAERARAFQYDVELAPMSAYERLVVHSALSGTPDIKTESRGEGQKRHVVIQYVVVKDTIV